MADIKSAEERSRNMAAIKSKDTKPEVFLRKLLFAEGYRYRKNTKVYNCQPDLWMKKYKVAVFINGCFWHRHEGCKYAYTPKSRTDYWIPKFEANVIRDKESYKTLNDHDVRCLIVWESTIKMMFKNEKYRNDYICKIEHFLSSQMSYLEL